MTRPLERIDEQLLQWRGVARRAAGKVKNRFPCCDIQDLEAACWCGVAKGLKTDNPTRGKLAPFLCLVAERAGVQWARKWMTHDLHRILGDEVPLSESMAWRDEPDGWADEDWASALASLPEYQRRVVELRFRGGLEFAAIGQVTGWSAKVARGVFREAIKELKRGRM